MKLQQLRKEVFCSEGAAGACFDDPSDVAKTVEKHGVVSVRLGRRRRFD